MIYSIVSKDTMLILQKKSVLCKSYHRMRFKHNDWGPSYHTILHELLNKQYEFSYNYTNLITCALFKRYTPGA